MRKPTKFPALVAEEAKNLKKFATKEELDNLNIYTLNTNNINRCIYGQLTGNCKSERAIELIEKYAKRVYHSPTEGETPGESHRLNGSPKKIARMKEYGDFNYFSPIEVHIDRADQTMNAKLIDFLKGKRRRLQ